MHNCINSIQLKRCNALGGTLPRQNFVCRSRGIDRKSGTRLTTAYDVTIQRYRKSHTNIKVSKTHILQWMGSKFCVKFLKCSVDYDRGHGYGSSAGVDTGLRDNFIAHILTSLFHSCLNSSSFIFSQFALNNSVYPLPIFSMYFTVIVRWLIAWEHSRFLWQVA